MRRIAVCFWIFFLPGCIPISIGPISASKILPTAALPSQPTQKSNSPSSPAIPLPTLEAQTIHPESTHFPTVSSTTAFPSTWEFRSLNLKMIDAIIGWGLSRISSQMGIQTKILRTADGGQTWKDITPTTPPAPSGGYAFVPAISFVDVNTAVAMVELRTSMGDGTLISQMTHDGGQTWQMGEIEQSGIDVDSALRQLFMVDAQHGWMVSNNGVSGMGLHPITLWWTDDGGKHWGVLYQSANHMTDKAPPPSSLRYDPFGNEQVVFTTPTQGFFTTVDMLYQTKDGGKSWQKVTLPSPKEYPDLGEDTQGPKYLVLTSLPHFTSSQDGFLLRRIYEFASQVTMPPVKIQGLPQAQYLYVTHDSGQTWSPQLTPAKMGTVFFLDAKTGWLLGKSNPDPSKTSQLFQTTDGGLTWKALTAEIPLPLGSEIHFRDADQGYAFIPPEAPIYYADFDVRNSFEQYAAHAQAIYVTQDEGLTWTKVVGKIAP